MSHTESDIDHIRPRYGHGDGQRPLWSSRDYVADLIRRTLRRDRHKETRDWPTRLGFAVEGGQALDSDGPGPFFVACTSDDKMAGPGAQRYRATLEKAGWTVGFDHDGDLYVDASQPLANPPKWLARAFARQSYYGQADSPEPE